MGEFGTDVMEIGKWYCSYMWCPSQCYCHVQDKQGTSYILYLRWRWDDPWTGEIVTDAYNEDSMDSAKWSKDLFEERNLYFTSIEHEAAKAALLAIWNEMDNGN